MVRSVQACGEMMTSDSRPTLIPDTDADDDLSGEHLFFDECFDVCTSE